MCLAAICEWVCSLSSVSLSVVHSLMPVCNVMVHQQHQHVSRSNMRVGVQSVFSLAICGTLANAGVQCDGTSTASACVSQQYASGCAVCLQSRYLWYTR